MINSSIPFQRFVAFYSWQVESLQLFDDLLNPQSSMDRFRAEK